MSPGLHRLGLFYYNFSAILCLKFQDGTYNVSSIQAFCNVLKVPLVFAFIVLLALQPSLKAAVFIETFVDLKAFSRFSVFSITIIIVITQFQVIALGIFQFIRKRKILHFVIKAYKITIEEKYLKNFKNICLRRSLRLNLVLILITLVQYYGAMKINLLSLAVVIICGYPTVVMFSFVAFVISFESFLFVLLKQFKKDLKKNLTSLSHERFLKLSQQYQSIYDIGDEFKKSFGAQLTMITVLYTLCLVLNVIFLIFHV